MSTKLSRQLDRLANGIAFAGLAILMQSCSSSKKETAAPIFTPDPAAFEYALSKAADVQLYSAECSTLSAEMEGKAKAALESWNQRNWPQTHAADQQYTQKLKDQTIIYNNEKISLPAVNLYAEIQKTIKIKLDQTRHSRTNVIDTCTSRLAAIDAGQYDLSQNTNADLYLKSLVTEITPPAYKVPTLAGSLNVLSSPGRSQFNLEKTLRESGCESAKILTLRNEWPHESYGAFCPNGKTVFVGCEWGECSNF